MKLISFRVYLDDPAAPVTHDLVVMPADRMRAERASTAELPPSQRGPNASATHSETYLLLWLWCAARRVLAIPDTFSDWCERVLDYDRLTADGEVMAADDTDDDATLDPTRPGAATS